MIEISDFYKNKSSTERKLEILTEITTCERLLESDDFSVIGGACMMFSELSSISSSIKLSPKLSDKFCASLKIVLQEHLEELKKLQQQIEQENNNEN